MESVDGALDLDLLTGSVDQLGLISHTANGAATHALIMSPKACSSTRAAALLVPGSALRQRQSVQLLAVLSHWGDHQHGLDLPGDSEWSRGSNCPYCGFFVRRPNASELLRNAANCWRMLHNRDSLLRLPTMSSDISANSGCNEPDDRYRLKPEQLPMRLELEMDPQLLNVLKEMSQRSGRCLDEIVLELLSKAALHPPEEL
jgi:hypothetical protein